ncbi:XdhC/CoxI family protein [Zobellia amurskyensis]|uniref:XdhC/CoxI family protein n=1 Tax=Zobellia amurskyensis TaxID=248905 RepID=A0A7X3D262_9FLAO|nr:XdhC/CoxI family protein [Zobellia amurskyensis]MUH36781.1 XdhC/CoxI family protein [Zobellia amurskyensis]
MTHELKNIIRAYKAAKEKKQKTVLATVVALEGSSYRRPGVRMLIREDGKRVGAVSGGCVEKEIVRQAETVFTDDMPKMMIYDGRYRLGCEGILYILIEPFVPSITFLDAFEFTLKSRKKFKIISSFTKEEGSYTDLGSFFVFNGEKIGLKDDAVLSSDRAVFEQQMNPCFKLIIIGAEHDAVQLCSYASLTGWEVTIVVSAAEEKSITDFPGANLFLTEEPETLSIDTIDNQTAIVLMTHSYVRDLKYLLAIKESSPVYLGLLGPAKRREKLLNEFMEHYPEVSDAFFDVIHGPAGLDIGAETAQEIAMAILSEILSVTRNKEPIMLKNKLGRIHT